MSYHDELPHHRVIRYRNLINKKDQARGAVDHRKRVAAQLHDIVRRTALDRLDSLITIESESIPLSDFELITTGVVILTLEDWLNIWVLLDTASRSGAVQARKRHAGQGEKS